MSDSSERLARASSSGKSVRRGTEVGLRTLLIFRKYFGGTKGISEESGVCLTCVC